MFSAASSVPREGEAQRTKRSTRSCFSASSSGEPFQLPAIMDVGLLQFGILAVEMRDDVVH